MTAKQWIKNKAQIAREAFRQDEAIETCILCHPLKLEIEAHHKTVKSVARATVEIARCPECQARIYAITCCAKKGHIRANGNIKSNEVSK